MPKTCILGEQLYLTPLDIYWYLGFRMMLRFAQIAKVWQMDTRMGSPAFKFKFVQLEAATHRFPQGD